MGTPVSPPPPPPPPYIDRASTKTHTASPRWLIMFTVYQSKPSIIFLVIWNDTVQTSSETKCPWIPTLPLLLLHYPYFSYITPISPTLPLFLLHYPYIYILVINLLLFFTMLRVLEVSIHGFLTWQASSLSSRPSGHVIFYFFLEVIFILNQLFKYNKEQEMSWLCFWLRRLRLRRRTQTLIQAITLSQIRR